jgi:N-acetylated-alpha-linked acidic dipeptidase
MEHFGDPEFLTHATAARLYTLIAMRAASSEIVPLTFAPYAEALRDHVDELRRLIAKKARKSGEAFDTPGLDDVVASVRAFGEAAEALDRATRELAHAGEADDATLAEVNDALVSIERAFLLPDGLPGRGWFRHAIYAPGLTTGYACWPLPGPRQALEEDDSDLWAEQAKALVERLDAATGAMREATGRAGG